MAGCPYTWVRGFFSSGAKSQTDPSRPASNLMVRVVKSGEERVRVALPARSARWLIDLIPDDVVARIREEDIPLEALALDLSQQGVLYPREIFTLQESHRSVQIWLE
jgi:hypothetical protein